MASTSLHTLDGSRKSNESKCSEEEIEKQGNRGDESADESTPSKSPFVGRKKKKAFKQSSKKNKGSEKKDADMKKGKGKNPNCNNTVGDGGSNGDDDESDSPTRHTRSSKAGSKKKRRKLAGAYWDDSKAYRCSSYSRNASRETRRGSKKNEDASPVGGYQLRKSSLPNGGDCYKSYAMDSDSSDSMFGARTPVKRKIASRKLAATNKEKLSCAGKAGNAGTRAAAGTQISAAMKSPAKRRKRKRKSFTTLKNVKKARLIAKRSIGSVSANDLEEAIEKEVKGRKKAVKKRRRGKKSAKVCIKNDQSNGVVTPGMNTSDTRSIEEIEIDTEYEMEKKLMEGRRGRSRRCKSVANLVRNRRKRRGASSSVTPKKSDEMDSFNLQVSSLRDNFEKISAIVSDYPALNGDDTSLANDANDIPENEGEKIRLEDLTFMFDNFDYQELFDFGDPDSNGSEDLFGSFHFRHLIFREETAKQVKKNKVAKPVQVSRDVSQPVSDACEVAKSGSDACKVVKHVADACNDAKPVTDLCKDAKPVVDAGKVAKPVADVCKDAKPVVDAGKVAKPVADVCKDAKPVVDAGKVAKPVVDAGKVAKPVADVAKVAKPVAEACKNPKSCAVTCASSTPKKKCSVVEEDENVRQSPRRHPSTLAVSTPLLFDSVSENGCEKSTASSPLTGGMSTRHAKSRLSQKTPKKNKIMEKVERRSTRLQESLRLQLSHPPESDVYFKALNECVGDRTSDEHSEDTLRCCVDAYRPKLNSDNGCLLSRSSIMRSLGIQRKVKFVEGELENSEFLNTISEELSRKSSDDSALVRISSIYDVPDSENVLHTEKRSDLVDGLDKKYHAEILSHTIIAELDQQLRCAGAKVEYAADKVAKFKQMRSSSFPTRKARKGALRSRTSKSKANNLISEMASEFSDSCENENGKYNFRKRLPTVRCSMIEISDDEDELDVSGGKEEQKILDDIRETRVKVEFKNTRSEVNVNEQKKFFKKLAEKIILEMDGKEDVFYLDHCSSDISEITNFREYCLSPCEVTTDDANYSRIMKNGIKPNKNSRDSENIAEDVKPVLSEYVRDGQIAGPSGVPKFVKIDNTFDKVDSKKSEFVEDGEIAGPSGLARTSLKSAYASAQNKANRVIENPKSKSSEFVQDGQVAGPSGIPRNSLKSASKCVQIKMENSVEKTLVNDDSDIIMNGIVRASQRASKASFESDILPSLLDYSKINEVFSDSSDDPPIIDDVKSLPSGTSTPTTSASEASISRSSRSNSDFILLGESYACESKADNKKCASSRSMRSRGPADEESSMGIRKSARTRAGFEKTPEKPINSSGKLLNSSEKLVNSSEKLVNSSEKLLNSTSSVKHLKVSEKHLKSSQKHPKSSENPLNSSDKALNLEKIAKESPLENEIKSEPDEDYDEQNASDSKTVARYLRSGRTYMEVVYDIDSAESNSNDGESRSNMNSTEDCNNSLISDDED